MIRSGEGWKFTAALVRMPCDSAVNGLREPGASPPDIDRLRVQHHHYVTALRQAGLDVDVLEALDTYPDSMFIEDAALTFNDAAIVLRPGAASRFGEAGALERDLRHRFERVTPLPGPGSVDGGDVLITPHGVFIGLSERTDAAGAAALVRSLEAIDRKARVVAPPPGTLHLKSACGLLDEDTVLVTEALVEGNVLESLRTLMLPPGEERAANVLRVNEVLFVDATARRTIDLLDDLGYQVVPIELGEVVKLNAGLSCMSLRW